MRERRANHLKPSALLTRTCGKTVCSIALTSSACQGRIVASETGERFASDRTGVVDRAGGCEVLANPGEHGSELDTATSYPIREDRTTGAHQESRLHRAHQ